MKSKPEILSDNTTVDPRPVYKTTYQRIPEEMTVGKLKEALLDENEDNSPLCLDLSQRNAVYNALQHPLTIIQVRYSLQNTPTPPMKSVTKYTCIGAHLSTIPLQSL